MEVVRKQNYKYAQRTYEELRITFYYAQTDNRRELSNKDEVRNYGWRMDKLEAKEKREECQEEIAKTAEQFSELAKIIGTARNDTAV